MDRFRINLDDIFSSKKKQKKQTRMEYDRGDRLLKYPVEIFHYCYRMAEKFLSKTFQYCLCNLYQDCQTKHGHLQDVREYCCICQIVNRCSIVELMAVKNDIFKLSELYIESLEDTQEIYKVVRGLAFWEEEVEFKFKDKSGKESRPFLRDSIEFLYSL